MPRITPTPPRDLSDSSDSETEDRTDLGLQFQNHDAAAQARSLLISRNLQDLLDFTANCTHEAEMEIYSKTVSCIRSWSRSQGFSILRQLFVFLENIPCTDFCLKSLISGMVQLCLHSRCWESDELLLSRLGAGVASEAYLNKLEAAGILVSAFFCIFPEREWTSSINFCRLFDDTENLRVPKSSWIFQAKRSKLEKLKCIINYFNITLRRLETEGFEALSAEKIYFTRTVIQDPEATLADFIQSSNSLQLSPLFPSPSGSIETKYDGIQVDFANKNVGGGTLGNGAAMEEILFACCPELILASLLADPLEDSEALLVHGAERFSYYKGYGASFAFAGELEGGPCRVPHVLLLDALNLTRDEIPRQYSRRCINRELIKCLAGFIPTHRTSPDLAIASGKWGCGVFNGDPELKCIIQWLSASSTGRPLYLYTFGDQPLAQKLLKLRDVATANRVSVSFLYSILMEFNNRKEVRNKGRKGGAASIADFVIGRIQSCKRPSSPSPPQVVKTPEVLHGVSKVDEESPAVVRNPEIQEASEVPKEKAIPAPANYFRKFQQLFYIMFPTFTNFASYIFGTWRSGMRSSYQYIVKLWNYLYASMRLIARHARRTFKSSSDRDNQADAINDVDDAYSDTD